MCGTDIRNELPLTPTTESPCGCGTPAPDESAAPAEGTAYGVEGLTCGSCVQRVQKAVAALGGVDSATVALVAGGTSTLTVAGSASPEDVRQAVTGAGYTVTA